MRHLLTLLSGRKGHPTHPPLTDIVIGGYAVATLLVVLTAAGVNKDEFGPAAVVVMGITLLFGIPTIITGLIDWFRLEKGSQVKRTATFHMILMLMTGLAFAIAEELLVSGGAADGTISTPGLILTITAFLFLTAGGYLGGTVVFVHGVRVEHDSKP